MEQVKLADFRATATERFGEDTKDWVFVCPQCKTKQTANEWNDEGIDREVIGRQIGFSCIGRHVKDKGCDWTLGGLFKLHELEIIDDEGGEHPHFVLAETK